MERAAFVRMMAGLVALGRSQDGTPGEEYARLWAECRDARDRIIDATAEERSESMLYWWGVALAAGRP